MQQVHRSFFDTSRVSSLPRQKKWECIFGEQVLVHMHKVRILRIDVGSCVQRAFVTNNLESQIAARHGLLKYHEIPVK
jgi:hypothetical protein